MFIFRGILGLFVVFVVGIALAFLLFPESEKVITPIKNLKLSEKLPVKSKPMETSILFTGDVMLGRTVMTTSLDKDDPLYPFRDVSEKLSSADITFVNLENPVVDNCPRHYTGFKFCADPAMVEGLTFAGIGVVTLANNHSGNYGKSGLDETFSYLDAANIGYTHNGSLYVVEENGLEFGFVGFNYVGFVPQEDDYAKVADYDGKVDVLIVSPHWGIEYRSEPSPIQREWAKKFVENGADVIVGHHPHWIQSMEHIKSDQKIDPVEGNIDYEPYVPVYYSLGNFIFDQMWSENTKKGLVLELTFDEEGRVVNEETSEVYMSEWAKPEWVN